MKTLYFFCLKRYFEKKHIFFVIFFGELKKTFTFVMNTKL